MDKKFFWDRYTAICRENGVKPREIARELSISPAAVTRWKNGSTPNDGTIKRLADRLNVSEDYLLGRDYPDTKEVEINIKVTITVDVQQDSYENPRKE